MWYFESRRLWRLEAPTQARGLGSADAPSGVQGQTRFGGPGSEAPGSKMNSTFWHCQKLPFLREILKSLTSWKAVLLFYLFILDNFWSRKFWYFFYLETLKSRALQMPFPTFSRGIISHQIDITIEHKKIIMKMILFWQEAHWNY